MEDQNGQYFKKRKFCPGSAQQKRKEIKKKKKKRGGIFSEGKK